MLIARYLASFCKYVVTLLTDTCVGPGPGRYALPSNVGYVKHDYSKRMNPAYSFGQKLSDLSKLYWYGYRGVVIMI